MSPRLDFNHQVFAEDKEIVESQCPEELPIDLSEEVHIRADKSSIWVPSVFLPQHCSPAPESDSEDDKCKD
jgi:phenylpropionate dioxygenase-like ring-hydroxylating dioxygenase large terminal subunit